MLLDNDQTVATMSSGTAFPLTNLVLDMWCFRTDLKQMFQLTALTPVWTMQFDLNAGARWQPALTTAGVGTAYTLTPVKPITAYLAGQSFNVTFNVASGEAPTLQISGVITPPNLVKRLGDGSFVNIVAGDFPAGYASNVTLISPTQAWVEQLQVTVTTILPNSVNLNTIVASGFYRILAAPVNGPPGATDSQMIVSRGIDTIAQIVIVYGSGITYTRAGTPTDVGGAGAWSAWRETAISGGNVASTTTIGGVGVIGYRDVPQVTFVVDTTLGLTDASKHLLHPSADITARTLTIPANAAVPFPIGTVVTVVNQNAAGSLSIAITTDVMRMAGPGTVGTRILAANGMCTIIKLAAAEWLISGVGLT